MISWRESRGIRGGGRLNWREGMSERGEERDVYLQKIHNHNHEYNERKEIEKGDGRRDDIAGGGVGCIRRLRNVGIHE